MDVPFSHNQHSIFRMYEWMSIDADGSVAIGDVDGSVGIGGFRFRLNDFNFTGTGQPFIPYTPRNLPNELERRPF